MREKIGIFILLVAFLILLAEHENLIVSLILGGVGLSLFFLGTILFEGKKKKIARMVKKLTVIHQQEKSITDYPTKEEEKIRGKARELTFKINKELAKNPVLKVTAQYPPEISKLIHFLDLDQPKSN